jgi:hypothetical protein
VTVHALPSPFDLDLEDFLCGPGGDACDLDVDDVFAKDLERVVGEMHAFSPGELLPVEGGAVTASLIRPDLSFVEVGCGTLLVDGSGAAVGGYLSCDLSLRDDLKGIGLGREIVIEHALRSGDLPTWHLDAPAYSRAGLAAHRAAWRHARSNPGETAARAARLV